MHMGDTYIEQRLCAVEYLGVECEQMCEDAPENVQDMKLYTQSKNGVQRRDVIFTVLASLAAHIGFVLLLSTATAMSGAFNMGNVSILHVSLVSFDGIERSQDGGKVRNTGKAGITEVTPEYRVVNMKDVTPSDGELVKAREVVSGDAQSITLPSTPKNISSVHITAGSGMLETLSTSTGKGKNEHYARLTGGDSHGKGVTMAIPRYRENAPPPYPWIARLRGYEGVVVISVEVTPEGKVGNVSLKKSSGYAVLDRSALDTVITWKFEPGRRMGIPVSMWVDVPLRFVLEKNESM